MRKVKLMLVALAALAAPLGAAPAVAQMVPVEAQPGPWSPDGVRDLSFPDTIGGYQRVSVNTYGGSNWAVGYNWREDDTLKGVITIYYIAARTSCPEELASSERALTKASPTAKKVTGGTTAGPRGRADVALHSGYSNTASFGGTERAIMSDIYLYCRPGAAYWIKARVTWPAGAPSDLPMILRAISFPAAATD